MISAHPRPESPCMPSFRLAPSLLMLLAAAGMAAADPGDGQLPGNAAAPSKKCPPKVEIAPLPLPSTMATAVADAPVAAITPPAVQPVARWAATFIMHAESGKQPTSCALMDDGHTLVVSNRGDNSVTIFDSERLEL